MEVFEGNYDSDEDADMTKMDIVSLQYNTVYSTVLIIVQPVSILLSLP